MGAASAPLGPALSPGLAEGHTATCLPPTFLAPTDPGDDACWGRGLCRQRLLIPDPGAAGLRPPSPTVLQARTGFLGQEKAECEKKRPFQ